MAEESQVMVAMGTPINDAMQEALALNLINEYNQESVKYTSEIVHLGVLMKRALSMAEQAGAQEAPGPR